MPTTKTITPINFAFEGHNVRVITDKYGDPWWMLNDVCKSCSIANPRNVSARLDDDQKGVCSVDTLGGPQKVTIVNESGLYEVILRSDKPEARRFRKWITNDVLPQIRKTGMYINPSTVKDTITSDMVLAIGMALKEAEEGRALAEARVAELEPDAELGVAFRGAPELMIVRDAAKYLTTAGVPIGEHALFAWLVEHEWIYRAKSGGYRPYAKRVRAGHLRLVPAKAIHCADGRVIMPEPTVKITRAGLALLFRRMVEEAEQSRLRRLAGVRQLDF